MLGSFLMGLVGGQRAMTPLAAIAVASALRRSSSRGAGVPGLLRHPVLAAAAVALAIGEMIGDKQATAPDRVVPVGLAARFVTSALAGAALAPPRRRWPGAVVGGATAMAASYPGWRARIAAIPAFGQIATGLAEDAVVIASAAFIVGRSGSSAAR